MIVWVRQIDNRHSKPIATVDNPRCCQDIPNFKKPVYLNSVIYVTSSGLVLADTGRLIVEYSHIESIHFMDVLRVLSSSVIECRCQRWKQELFFLGTVIVSRYLSLKTRFPPKVSASRSWNVTCSFPQAIVIASGSVKWRRHFLVHAST